MKYKLTIVAIIILLGNQKSFSQNNSIKGKCVDYETSEEMPGVTMSFYTHSGEKQGTSSNVNGIFELKMRDDSEYLIIRFIGCYLIKFLNIPQEVKHMDFGEIKIVQNYGRTQFNMNGSPAEAPLEWINKDRKMRKDVIEKYRIKVLGENFKPYFEGKYLVFNFDKKEEK